jgi:hypothetical protein
MHRSVLSSVGRCSLAAAAAGFVALWGGGAVAGDDDEKKGEDKKEEGAKEPAPPPKPKKAPKAPAAANAEPAAESDHANFVGTFAVGFMGAAQIPFVTNVRVDTVAHTYTRPGTPPQTVQSQLSHMSADATVLNAPAVGVRYWFSEMLGVDVALGLRTFGGSITQHYARTATDESETWEADVKNQQVSQFGLLFHAGVPIALHAEKHYTFLVVPETNIGISSGTLKAVATFQDPEATQPVQVPADIKLSGLRFDMGGRVGAEIHFGFMGVPNLALQAGVGLYLSYTKISAKGGSYAAIYQPPPQTSLAGRRDTSYEQTATTVNTTVSSDPWAIFTNNISALYYF